jgi:peptidylprolyl isomerase
LKKVIAAAVASLSIFALSGCAPSDTNSAYSALDYSCGTANFGENAKQISLVDGSDKPAVEFPTPLVSDQIETKVLVEGDGPEIKGLQSISVDFIAYNGADNKLLQESSFAEESATTLFLSTEGTPNFCTALSGVKGGSTVAVILPPKDAHNNQGIADFGMGPDDALVFVFKIDQVFLPRALGASQPATAGFPTVVTSTEGVPGVTIPKSDAPSEFKVANLITGNGSEIAEGDTVVVHYSGFLWNEGTQFDSSWENGQPAEFEVAEGSLISGFVKALVGQKVGSQVVAIIPPSEGYGDQGNDSIPANSTLVFVVDILGIK